MTPDEFCKLLKYFEENNSWGAKMFENSCKRRRRVIKYLDSTFDSRSGKIFSVCFRDGFTNKEFRLNGKSDVDKIYQWLDELSEERINK